MSNYEFTQEMSNINSLIETCSKKRKELQLLGIQELKSLLDDLNDASAKLEFYVTNVDNLIDKVEDIIDDLEE